ncbi:hypothetical protein SAY87_013562 [Trapa incisa]|uniref:Uncharacterized protein n=1 Tax=Trapa incisa TaxID=236973 RepID=A0AAN7KBQ5_9MYRT|nr:hypothetical protein SAY87_013562 [Trapa incisa]
MREGLRSGKLRQRVQNDEGSLGNVVAQMLFGTDCKKKRKREDDGEECQYPPRTGKYRVEDELSDGKVPITDWVLRSRMRSVEVEEQHIGKDDALDCEVKRGRGHKIETEGIRIAEDNKSSDLIGRAVEKTLKRKRGRPPKAFKACDVMPNLRGRPPLAWGTVGVLGNYIGKNKRIIETKDSFKQTRPTGKSKRESKLNNDSKSKSPSLDFDFESKCAEVEYESVIEAKESIQGGEDEGITRALEKQLVRNRIIELLFDAGWTVIGLDKEECMMMQYM